MSREVAVQLAAVHSTGSISWLISISPTLTFTSSRNCSNTARISSALSLSPTTRLYSNSNFLGGDAESVGSEGNRPMVSIDRHLFALVEQDRFA